MRAAVKCCDGKPVWDPYVGLAVCVSGRTGDGCRRADRAHVLRHRTLKHAENGGGPDGDSRADIINLDSHKPIERDGTRWSTNYRSPLAAARSSVNKAGS